MSRFGLAWYGAARCVVHGAACRGAALWGGMRGMFECLRWCTSQGNDYIGHTYVGQNYIGNYLGHTYAGHNYVGHNCIGNAYFCHNYIGAVWAMTMQAIPTQAITI